MTPYKRYRGIIPSCEPGRSYTVTLQREDALQSDPMRTLTFYGEGFTLERETQESLLAPIRPTRLTLFLRSEVNYQYEHIAKDSKEWSAEVRLGSEMLFLGRIETGLYEEDFAEPPYEVRMVATCGLQSLYDRDLTPEEVPTNGNGVTAVRDFIDYLLRKAYPKGYARSSDIRGLAAEEIYIDAMDFVGADKPVKMGEALETLLHDLCLSVCSEGERFVVCGALESVSDDVVLLGSSTLPLYATPQLQSDRGIGQLYLTLPQERVPTLAPYTIPQGAMPVRDVPEHPFAALGAAYPPPLRTLAATPGTTAQAPTEEERQNGIALKLSALAEAADDRGVLLGFFIDAAFYDYPIEVTIPMRFAAKAGEPIPESGTIMHCLDAWLCHYDTSRGTCEVCYQASVGDVYRQMTVGTPLAYSRAEDREASRHLYRDSGMGRRPQERSTAGWTDCRMAHNVVTDDIRTERYATFADELEAHRNYSHVEVAELFAVREFATFRYSFLPPLRHLMQYHNDRRSERGERPKPEPNYVLLRLPDYFWHYKESRDANPTRYHPDSIEIGKITVRYRSDEDKQHPVTEWLTADRATPFLRRHEEELTYSTREERMVQLPDLRCKLLDAEGKWLSAVGQRNGKDVTLVEYCSEQYMRTFARPHDTLTATIGSTARPQYVGLRRFAVKGRPGKSYRIAGAIYHPGEGAGEELTLVECPPAQYEETTFTH